MVGQGQVLLHLGELVGQNHAQRVFLPVQRFRFECGIDLRKGHRRGVGLQRPDPVQVDRVGNHADLQAGQVFHLVDGTLAVGHVAKAKLPVGQADNAFFRQLVVHLLAKGAVDHGVGFLAVGEQERKVINGEFLDLAGQNAGIHRDHLQRAALHRRHVGRVPTQHPTREQVDLDLAAGLGGDDVGKLFHAGHDRMAFGVLCGELDRAVFVILRAGDAKGGQCGGGYQGFDHQTFHACLQWGRLGTQNNTGAGRGVPVAPHTPEFSLCRSGPPDHP